MNTKKSINRFKDSPIVQDRKRYNQNDRNNYNYKNSYAPPSLKREKKELDLNIISSEIHFPELAALKPNNTIKNKETVEQPVKLYSDIVEIEKTNEDNVEKENKLKPGWVILNKLDKYESNDNFIDSTLLMEKMKQLYEKNKKEYIKIYGEDNYEKCFKFPNYDYEYFNRLDYLYELEMEALMNMNNENDDYHEYD